MMPISLSPLLSVLQPAQPVRLSLLVITGVNCQTVTLCPYALSSIKAQNTGGAA